MRNMSNTRNVIDSNLSLPYGMAVDWLANNIYWIDFGNRLLQVARLDGSCRKTIISTDLHKPRSVAVFPMGG